MSKKATAILSGPNDTAMMGYGLWEERDGTDYVALPTPIAEYVEQRFGMVSKGFGVYHNDDRFVSIAPKEDGHDIKHRDGKYWIEITDGMDEILPLDNSTRFPVVLLGCGEVWLFAHDDLWDKLAAELMTSSNGDKG